MKKQSPPPFPVLSRRLFIRNNALTIAGTVFVPRWIRKEYAGALTENTNQIQDILKPAESAIIEGFIGKKLDQSYENRVFAQDVDELIAPFRNRTESHLWQTEFWGKWFTSAILAYKYRPNAEKRKILDTAVKELIKTQTPDGYIGNYRTADHLKQWDIWGRKYCLLGLLDYYELTGDKASLNAAEKLVKHLMKELAAVDGEIVTKGNYRGMPASSILEGVVRLYTQTKDMAYLQFSEDIVRQWETPDGPMLLSKAEVNVGERFPKPKPANWYSWEQGQKAYEMMSCYEGLIELYRVTGKKPYLKAVEDTWNNILATEINLAGSGASYEMWFGGKSHQSSPIVHYQETCVTVTWIKFNQQLLRLTGESKYADEIERAYYNALLGALSADGASWAKYTPLNGERLAGSGQCGMTLNCCEANGPRGQFTFPLTAVMALKDGISVNFFAKGSYNLKTPAGRKITIMQQTDYPVSGKININLIIAEPEEMEMRIRIPNWSHQTVLQLNGKNIQAVPGKYAVIKKTWSATDKISLTVDMRGRVMRNGKDQLYAAVQRGPLVLCRDTRLSNVSLGITVTPLHDKDGYITLKPVENTKEDIWYQAAASFSPEFYKDAPETPKPLTIVLCDYASAGNGHDHSSFQVWMPQLYDPRLS